MVYAQPRIFPEECHTQTPLELCDTDGLANLGQTTIPYYNQQKKIPDCRICCLVGPQSKIERMRKEGSVPQSC